MPRDPKKIYCGFCSWRTNRVYMTQNGEIRGQDTAFDRLSRHVEDHHPEQVSESETEPILDSDFDYEDGEEEEFTGEFTGELSWGSDNEGW